MSDAGHKGFGGEQRSLLLVGTGLIGGSFALAAKQAGIFEHVVGLDSNPQALGQARQLGVIDSQSDTLDAGCDAVCVAVPVGDIAAAVQEAAVRAPVVFDVGSVKGAVIEALAPVPPNYVPCHPIAGSERTGPAAASASLFQGASVAMTPLADTDASAVATVRSYWEAAGGVVTVERPEEHDERLALLSHLPHLLAFAFMEVAGSAKSLDGAGGGFRDFTRIAAADSRVWADILHGNAAPVRRYLEELIGAMRGFQAAAEGANGELRARIDAAAEIRRAIDLADS